MFNILLKLSSYTVSKDGSKIIVMISLILTQDTFIETLYHYNQVLTLYQGNCLIIILMRRISIQLVDFFWWLRRFSSVTLSIIHRLTN